MPLQYFALDSTHVDYATVKAALSTANAANFSYTPTLVERAATYDSDIKIVAAVVDEGDLTGDLADLADAAVPNALCQHRWYTASEFRFSGFHQLNETVRSPWGVASRTYKFARPQQTYGETASNYGDGTGTNWYNALNGMQDSAINGGANTTLQLSTDYFLCEGLHYRWDDGSNPSNAVTDARTLGEAGRIRILSDPGWPGMFWGSTRAWDRTTNTTLPFEEYDSTNHVYVCGGYRVGGTAYTGGTFLEFDMEDMTQDATTLLQRHSLYGKANLSDLDGTTGRARFHVPTSIASGLCESCQVWNGSAFTDYTITSRPAPGNVIALAVSAPNDSAIYFGRTLKFNNVNFHSNGPTTFQVGGTGVWEYRRNDSTWVAIPTLSDGTSAMTTSGILRFLTPSDWATTTVNIATAMYYIRWRKTGGTVTQAASVEWIDHDVFEPWLAVRTFDGTATYTDVSWEATDNTSNNIEALVASAANNAGIYFCAERTFTHILIDLSQVQIGGTLVLEYSKGSGTWGTFTNSVDPTVGLTTGTAATSISFNPKLDWATDTVDGVTGYWVRLRKTAGTVTQAARLDGSLGFYDRSLYVHRWNDGAVVNGMANTEEASSAGITFLTSGKGNIEFHRVRSFGIVLLNINTDEVFFTGSQYVLGGSLQYSSGSNTWTFQTATHGTRWWSIADHVHEDKTDPFIQNIIAQIQWAIDNRNSATVNNVTGNTIGEDIEAALSAVGIADPDVTVFDNMGDCNDFMLFSEGMYGSGSSNYTKVYDGHKYRRCGSALDGLNDSNIYIAHGIDGHSDAHYGGLDAAALGSQYKRLWIEYGSRAINNYPQGEGSNDKPVSGSGANRRNMHFLYCYVSTRSVYDGGKGFGGVMFESDADAGNYDNGTGLVDGNAVMFCGFKDLTGGAIINTTPSCNPLVWFNEFDDPGTAIHLAGGFSNGGPRSTNAIRATTAPAYTDFTANVKDSGNTASILFPTGAAGEALYLGIKEFFTRRFTFDLTVNGVGTKTLAWKYWNGSAFTAVSNLSDGTNGFTQDGTVTFNRPTDAAQTDINGKTMYWVEVSIDTGSFTTVPQAVEISTYVECCGVNAQFNTYRNFEGAAAGDLFVNLFQGVGTALTNTGVVIEGNNTFVLSEGQDSTIQMYRINGVNNYSLPSWQGFSKPAATTDAPTNSVFGVDTNFIGP